MLLKESEGRGRAVGACVRPLAAIGALVALELLALVATRSAWGDVRAAGPASLDEAVLLIVLAVGAMVGGWVVLSTTVAVLAHLPGRLGGGAQRWAGMLAPSATRRLAALLVGAALSGAIVPASVAGPAAGDGAGPERGPGFTVTHPSPRTPSAPSAPSAPSDPAPGWTPSRPVHTATPAARLVTTGSTAAATDVVVHRGDTLWSIARRHLGAGATDVEVAAAWPSWYAANREVIGPDPDVLRPGQVLRAPDRTPSGHTVGVRR